MNDKQIDKQDSKQVGKPPTASQIRQASIAHLVSPEGEAAELSLAVRVQQIPVRSDWTKDQVKAITNQVKPLADGIKQASDGLQRVLFLLAVVGVDVKPARGAEQSAKNAHSRGARSGRLAKAYLATQRRATLSDREVTLFVHLGRCSDKQLENVPADGLMAQVEEWASADKPVSRDTVAKYVAKWNGKADSANETGDQGSGEGEGSEESSTTGTASDKRHSDAVQAAADAVAVLFDVWPTLTAAQRKSIMSSIAGLTQVGERADAAAKG